MTRTGIVRSAYGEEIERRPFSMFTSDEAEQEANQEWSKQADAWGSFRFNESGHRIEKFEIICRQGAPLSSWSDPRTEREIAEQFRDYALHEWDEVPPIEKFTLEFIAEVWQVDFQEASA